jgi:hypothetical protein
VKFLKAFFNLLIASSSLLQAGLTLELSRPGMSVDETVDLIMRFEDGGPPATPQIPLPEGLRVVATSRQEQVINFDRQSAVRYTLQADKPGSYQIGPFTLKGQKQEIPGLTLTVSEAKVVEANDDLFITMDSSSQELLVRESVEVSLTIYSRLSIGDVKMLDFDNTGFEITEWQQVQARPQQIGQKMYRVRRFVAQLTPSAPGTLTLDPTFRVDVLDGNEPFGMMFGTRSSRSLRIKLQTPLVLNVNAPPAEGRPEDYAGHLGNFRLTASVSPKEVKVGDPLTLRVELSGSGSLQQALPPGLKESDDFKVYQPKLVTEDMQRNGLSGRKIIEQVLIPKHEGVSEVPALTFSYYDTDSRQYKTLSAGPFPIDVLASTTSQSATTFSAITNAPTRAEPELLGDDLIYLKTRPGRILQLSRLQPGLPLAGASAFPFVVWALVGVICRQREKRGQDDKGLRRQQAPKRLRKHLAALDTKDGDLYLQIWQVLSDYLSARLDLPPGELNGADVQSRLPQHLSEAQRTGLRQWMQRCERARFSGEQHPADADTLREDFRHFILDLDRELGR